MMKRSIKRTACAGSRTRKRSFLLATLMFAGLAVRGETRIWVDAEADESTSGETLSYKTIEGAVNKATELARGDANNPVSVCVKDGTYKLTKEIVLTNGVTLVSENGRDKVTLIPAKNCRAVAVTGGTLAGVTIQGLTYAAGMRLTSDVDTNPKGLGIYMQGETSLVTNCLVRGVVLEGAQKESGGALLMKGGRCRDSVFTGCKGPFTVVGTSGDWLRLWNCAVTSNKVENPAQSVVWVQGGAEFVNCLVADNEIAETNAAVFFNVWSGTGLDNCTIAGNTGAGVSMGSTSGFSFNNCVIAGNTGGAFVLPADNKNTYKLYNCAYDADTLPMNFTVVASCLKIAADGGVFADPSRGDWRLAAGSPLIDAGRRQWLDREAAKAVTTDLDGRARLNNGGMDIGCYEFDKKLDDPVLQVGLDRLGTPQVVSQTGKEIKFRPQLLWHGQAVAPESVSYVWNGAEKSFGTDGTASETLTAVSSYDLVLKAVYDGQTVSNVLPKAFVCVGADATAKTFWVGASGSNESPYDTPETAAHSPVDAANAATGQKNATVLVMDGTYRFDETINLTNGVRMASVAGDPRRVVFKGGIDTDSMMIAVGGGSKTQTSGELSGVTVQDALGMTRRDGDLCQGVKVHGGSISNCIIRNIGGVRNWQWASHGCALTLGDNWWGLKAQAVDCIIEDNVSAFYKGETTDANAKNGAAVKIGQNGFMDRCIVRDNRADDNTRVAYAKVSGAGILMDHATAVCRNTLVADNVSASALGGVCLKAGRLENCTIAGNTGTNEETTVYGGGLYVAGGTVVNTIVTGNFAGTNEVNVALTNGLDAATVFTNCCLTGFAGGTDCLFGDPLLDADFRPGKKSPVINKGLKLDWMTADALDLAHNPRLYKRRPDMGCYEMPYDYVGFTLILR